MARTACVRSTWRLSPRPGSTSTIEDQILLSRVVLVALGEALERGVVVVALVPGDPMPELARYRAFPGIAAGYDALAALAGHAGFCLAAPAARRSWGYEEIYVHSKTMVVDDRWATIGSANLIFTSFQGDTEMNVSFWDSEVARAFRVRQVDEQGGFQSAAMGGREAVGRLAEVAGENADRRAGGEDLAGFWPVSPRGGATCCPTCASAVDGSSMARLRLTCRGLSRWSPPTVLRYAVS